jgi:hypothetical protein
MEGVAAEREPKAAGSPAGLAWKVLIVLGLLNLGRGSIHVFLPDGGAGRIAHFDLTYSFDVIVFLFAVMGLQQMALGIVDLLVAFRKRALALPLLWFHALEQTAGTIIIGLYKPPPGRPPGLVGAPLGLAVLWAVLAWIYWQRRHGAEK